jgi:hypothetical protein
MKTKYGFEKMEIGDVRVFKIDAWAKVRLAAHFAGKRSGMKFRTEKKIKTVIVTRID